MKKEHSFWNGRISSILKGYRDDEYEERVVNFIKDLNLKHLNEQEKELIFSKEMNNKIG